MRRALDPYRSLAAALAAAALALEPSPLRAQVTLSTASAETLEQRIAIALGPTRSVVWVAAHARPDAGPFALVVPARSGSAIDVATDAWLESLEAATAPRILPPDGIDAVCPGEPDGDPVHVAGDLEHHATLVPVEVATLAGAGDLLLWAAQNDLDVPGPVAGALADSTATHFVALRFASPGGDAWTPTIRVAFAEPEPILPLALAQAGTSEQIVTLFAFSEERVGLSGTRVEVDPQSLTFDVARTSSDYADKRSELLAASGSYLIETASHAVLVAKGALPGDASIPSVASAYFERAIDLGAGSGNPPSCARAAAAAIERPEPFAEACPRADLGVVDGDDTCVESPGEGESDPAALRCGGDTDDLALALSGLVGEAAWLTRLSVRIAPGQTGSDTATSSAADDVVAATLQAAGVDFSDCGEGGGGAGGSGATSSAQGATGQNGAGPTGSGGPASGPGGFTTVTSGAGEAAYVEIPVRLYDTTCGCSGDYTIVDYVEVREDEAPESGSYYTEDDGCDSDSAESYEVDDVESSPDDGGCSGETSGESGADDGCSGETAESSSDDGCSGDTGESSSDSGCGSDTGSDDSDCGCDESLGAPEGGRHARQVTAMRARPRFSVIAFGLALVVAPLRRLTRRKQLSRRG